MGTHMGHVLTLANSIIGVSVLAMPFCFRQCGIVLSVLMLLSSSYISRLACHHLIKSAIVERMKNFEMLAFRAFGPTGKLIVELCIIGFMLGTCVAFFVVIGDLGPNILGPILGLEHPSALRPSVLIGTAVLVVLPLGLLRNVDSLNGICAASLAFYGVLVLKVFLESASNLFSSDIWDKVSYWRPAGILRCIPIFSMALSCQTQLFEVFGSLPTTPLDRANAVVKSAVNLTTFFYVAVGFFGYIAYADSFLTGNVMMNFSSGASSDIIKICFLLSVAVSFPLVIFPCRASIYSFLYSKVQLSYEGFGSSHIPETRFQCITLVIVTVSLIIGMVVPTIEIVLGLVGSTMGVFICVITPGMIFTTVSQKRNNERLSAKFLVGTGVVIMVLGTYANLYATEETLTAPGHQERLDTFVNVEPPRELQPIKPAEEVVNSEDINSVLEKLKAEEKHDAPEIPKQESPEPKSDLVVESLKNFSPGLFSDQNPQPKLDEGPKPQPIAPEPPEEPQKKIPINILESLENLETQKKAKIPTDVETKKLAISNIQLATPDVIKKAMGASGIMERMAASKKSVDPVQPVPPNDKPKVVLGQDVANAKLKTAEFIDKEKVPPVVSKVPDVQLEKNSKPEKKIVEKTEEKMELKEQPAIEEKAKIVKFGPKLENEIERIVPAFVQKVVSENTKVDNFSMSMAQGLPLPLAIKGLDQKKPSGIDEVKIGREILDKSLEVELREKRDLDAVEMSKSVDLVGEKSENLGAEKLVSFSVLEKSDAEFKTTHNADRNSAEKAIKNDVKSPAGEGLQSTSKANSSPKSDSNADLDERKTEPVSLQNEPKLSQNLEVETHEHKYANELAAKNAEDEEECPKTTAKSGEGLETERKTESPIVKSLKKLSNESPLLAVESVNKFPDAKKYLSIHELGKQKK